MDSIKMSIIVPVYNAGIYFEECICSILSQTYTNYELMMGPMMVQEKNAFLMLKRIIELRYFSKIVKAYQLLEIKG